MLCPPSPPTPQKQHVSTGEAAYYWTTWYAAVQWVSMLRPVRVVDATTTAAGGTEDDPGQPCCACCGLRIRVECGEEDVAKDENEDDGVWRGHRDGRDTAFTYDFNDTADDPSASHTTQAAGGMAEAPTWLGFDPLLIPAEELHYVVAEESGCDDLCEDEEAAPTDAEVQNAVKQLRVLLQEEKAKDDLLAVLC